MTQQEKVLRMAVKGPVTARMAAVRLGVNAKSASKLLYRLEQRGLLERAEDGGGVSSVRMSYTLTDDGRVAASGEAKAAGRLDFGPLVSAFGIPCAELLARYSGAHPRVTHTLMEA